MSKKLEEIIDFMIDEKGSPVEINNMEAWALIWDATDNVHYYNDKFIRCKELIETGDKIFLIDENHTYLIISQVALKENHYRARLRKCNQLLLKEIPGEEVIVGYDPMGRPIYEYTDPQDIYFPAIAENRAMDIKSNQPIVLLENEIMAILQDNIENREHFIEDERFKVVGKEYRVIGVGRLQNGLITIKGELV
ncbi:hypothetical protein [Natronincola ferrireducens]|uniref:Uncharacterized protein n=1 Tax=Natronincola ferrireducens TaxID=393762 RepID=A0A1G9IHK8_9FIRM|nr:hypothetical protein [Natronincola ferrireducens]SDL24657.1 hypothetical protein SAMN05660472_02874 [Natronincola ferrireducens]